MELKIPDDIARKVDLASESVLLSMNDYILACIVAGLVNHSSHDPFLAKAFRMIEAK